MRIRVTVVVNINLRFIASGPHYVHRVMHSYHNTLWRWTRTWTRRSHLQSSVPFHSSLQRSRNVKVLAPSVSHYRGKHYQGLSRLSTFLWFAIIQLSMGVRWDSMQAMTSFVFSSSWNIKRDWGVIWWRVTQRLRSSPEPRQPKFGANQNQNQATWDFLGIPEANHE